MTGKGSVGKTTVACAFAHAAAAGGKRVLVVDLGADGSDAMATALGVSRLEAEPRPITDRLRAMRLRPGAGLSALAKDVLPARAFDGDVVRSPALRAFLATVPALDYVGVLYQWLALVRATEKDGTFSHELVVVDVPTIGYARALVELPRALARFVPMGSFSTTIRAALPRLCDPEKTGLVLVTLAEPEIARETLDEIPALVASGLPLAALVVNRVPYDPFSEEERALVRKTLAETPPVLGDRALLRIERARSAVASFQGVVTAPIVQLLEVWLEGAKLAQDMASVFEVEARS